MPDIANSLGTWCHSTQHIPLFRPIVRHGRVNAILCSHGFLSPRIVGVVYTLQSLTSSRPERLSILALVAPAHSLFEYCPISMGTWWHVLLCPANNSECRSYIFQVWGNWRPTLTKPRTLRGRICIPSHSVYRFMSVWTLFWQGIDIAVISM